jgi:hypothetical protein
MSRVVAVIKRLVRILVLTAIAYVGLCALMYFAQRSYVYFPQYTHAERAETDFELRRTDGVTLRGWVLQPNRRDAVLYFGGNAERIEDMGVLLSSWLPQCSIYLVPYRGYGASDGSPEEHALYDDALALFDRVRKLHADGRIDAIGRSLGSGIAAHLASRRPLDKLVLVTPFDRLANVASHHYPWLPVRWLLTEEFDSLSHLQGYQGSTMVIAAEYDEIIPSESTAALAAALRNVRFVMLAGAEHNTIDGDPGFGQAVSTFLAPTAGP